MKKLLIIMMVFLAFGCAKKYVKGTAETPAKEEAVTKGAGAPEKEVVEEGLYATKEGKVGEEEIIEAGMAGREDVFKDIYFDFDRYDIRADARPVLDEIATWMNKNTDTNIIIEGHCDERGTNEYNLALGEKRAKATRDYLISLGVSPSRITIVTYGEERPQCTEHNEACWQLNRRAHFVVTE
jgi:peptidoglycan-associated lipoprotein